MRERVFPLSKIRAFYGFLLSYSLILLIPLVIGGITYHESLRILESYEKEFNLTSLEKARDVLENALVEINQMTILLGNDPYVRKFAIQKNPLTGSSIYDVYELTRHLQSYGVRNQFVHSFYIYFRNNNRIVMKETFYEAPHFYGNYFTYNEMSYHEWQKAFLKSSHQKEYFPTVPVIINSFCYNMLTYIQSFPTVYQQNPTIVIWVLIDEEAIKSLLEGISPNGWVYIIDDNSQIISSPAEQKNILKDEGAYFKRNVGFIDEVIDDERLIISYTTSSYTGWKYVSVLPYRTVLAKTRFMKLLMIAAGIVILFLGFTAIYILALRNTKPIKELINVIRKNKPTMVYHKINEYLFISKNVRELIEMNRSLQKEMKEQLPKLRVSFFERLFKGEYTKEAEIQTFLSQLGIDIKGDYFSIILMRIIIYKGYISNDRLIGLFRAKAVVKDMVGRKFHGCLHVHDRAEDEIVLLMCFTASESGSYKVITEQLLLEIYEELFKKYSINVLFASGKIYPNLRDVWHSYRESIEASDTMRIGKEFKIAWYGESNEYKSSYYYPLNLEEQLINNVKAGNIEEVRNILTLAYRESIEYRTLSSDMLRIFMQNMRCTVIKVLAQIDLNDDVMQTMSKKLNGLHHYESFNDAYKIIKDIYESICTTIDSMKKSHKIELINDIKEYIQAQHQDLNLNRYRVSHEFGMTGEYFSSFFKEQTGLYFSDFLEEVRMQSASELLSNKEKSIGNIARLVGYNSVKAFSRAFKRVKGLRPSDYRNLIFKDPDKSIRKNIGPSI